MLHYAVRLAHKERQKNPIHSIYVRQKIPIHSVLGNRILLTYILLTNPSEQDSFDVYILSCAGRVAAQGVLVPRSRTGRALRVNQI